MFTKTTFYFYLIYCCNNVFICVVIIQFVLFRDWILILIHTQRDRINNNRTIQKLLEVEYDLCSDNGWRNERNISTSRLTKVFTLKYREGYSDWQPPEEAWRSQCPKHYNDNNKYEDIIPTINIVNKGNTSLQKLLLFHIISYYLSISDFHVKCIFFLNYNLVFFIYCSPIQGASVNQVYWMKFLKNEEL